jgi:hypothetical protein
LDLGQEQDQGVRPKAVGRHTTPALGFALLAPEGTAEYQEATSATVTPKGVLVVLRDRPRGFAEAIDEIPRGRWRSWSPGIGLDTDE